MHTVQRVGGIDHINRAVAADGEYQVGGDLREIQCVVPFPDTFNHGVDAKCVGKQVGVVTLQAFQQVVAGLALAGIGAGADQVVGAAGSSQFQWIAQNMAVVAGTEGLRFDRAGGVLQRPVAAARGAAGGIGRGGDVGAGQRSEVIEEFDTGCTVRDVAPVEQQVAVRRQRVAPAADLGAQCVEP